MALRKKEIIHSLHQSTRQCTAAPVTFTQHVIHTAKFAPDEQLLRGIMDRSVAKLVTAPSCFVGKCSNQQAATAKSP
eukprot:2822749-Amphidinium_carterae.2